MGRAFRKFVVRVYGRAGDGKELVDERHCTGVRDYNYQLRRMAENAIRCGLWWDSKEVLKDGTEVEVRR
jgi:hypothetical protein